MLDQSLQCLTMSRAATWHAGDTSTGILIGMQLPPETDGAFDEAKAQLADGFTFDELAGEARQVFNMFVS